VHVVPLAERPVRQDDFQARLRGLRDLPRRSGQASRRRMRQLPHEARRDVGVLASGRVSLRDVPRRSRQPLHGSGLRFVPQTARSVLGRVASGVQRLRLLPQTAGQPLRHGVRQLPQAGRRLQVGCLQAHVDRLRFLPQGAGQPLRQVVLFVPPDRRGLQVRRVQAYVLSVRVLPQGARWAQHLGLVRDVSQEPRGVLGGDASRVLGLRLLPQTAGQPLRHDVRVMPQASGGVDERDVQAYRQHRRSHLPKLRVREVSPERLQLRELHLPRRQAPQRRLIGQTRAGERPPPDLPDDARSTDSPLGPRSPEPT
jgi:hypothetical protein